MKLKLIKVIALFAVLGLLLTLGFGCKIKTTETTAAQSTAAATTAAAETTAAETTKAAAETTSGEPVKLVFWWWGEQEAPGLEKWLKETVDLYQKAHPNITIETVLQATETLMSAFKSAAAAQQGPDLQYFWGGIFTIEDAWAGNIVPISDYIPADELKHYYTSYEQQFDGKTWGAVWYTVPNPIVYNKQIFKDAGLDPENFPKTWDEFLAACKAIQAKGIVPFSVGNKEGFAGAWLASYIGIQNLDSPADLMAPAIGKAKYTDEKYAAWWKRLAELRDNKYINKDINSLEFYQGQDNFKKGNAGFTLTVGSGAVDFVKTMGTDKVGIATMPVWGTGKYAGPLQLSSQTVGITSWSKYPKESADFIMFMHTPDRVNAMYKMSGAFPADDRFDPSLLSTDQEKKIAKLASENVSPWGENYIPSQFDEQAYYFGVQDFFNGKTPEDMAKKCQEIIEKWQKEQPDSVKNFEKWYASFTK